MTRRPPRSTRVRSSAASDVYKRQVPSHKASVCQSYSSIHAKLQPGSDLSLIHISEPTRLLSISYAVFRLKKKTRARCENSTTKPRVPTKQQDNNPSQI